MEEFSCKRCGFSSPFKHSLIRHLKRKRLCSPILKEIPIDHLLKDYCKEEDLI